MNASALIGALAAAVILVGGYFVVAPGFQDPQDPNLGGSPGASVNWPSFEVNGRIAWHYRQAMVNASTTCGFRSPDATTTIAVQDATAQVTLAPTTTPQFEIGWAATPMATTTRLALHTFTAGTWRTIVATGTVTALSDGLVPPNSYINVKQGGGGGSFVPTGVCQLKLTQTL